MRISFFFIFVFLFYNEASAQESNPCNVKAVLIPANDSVISGYGPILFESASINATDYRIIINGVQYQSNSPIYTTISVGLTIVQLVAYNGSCTDTAVVHYFNSGTFPVASDNASRVYGAPGRDYEFVRLARAVNGGYIMAGRRTASNFFQESTQGILIKTKDEGCLEWAKRLLGNSYSDISLMEQAADGSFFLYAIVDSRVVIIKTDQEGSVIWAKRLKKSNGDYGFACMNIAPMPDGGVVLVGMNHDYTRGFVFRLNATGAIVWQKELIYNTAMNGSINQIVYKDGSLYMAGTFYTSGLSVVDRVISRLDYATGQTVWLKKYIAPSGGMEFYRMLEVDSTILVSFTSPTGQTTLANFGGIMRIGTDGNVKSARVYAENYTPNSLSSAFIPGRVELVKSGNSFYMASTGIYLLSLQPLVSSASKITRIDSDYHPLWMEHSGGIGAAIFNQCAPADNDGVMLGGRQLGMGIVPRLNGYLFSTKPIMASGSNETASCSLYEQQITEVPLNITDFSTSWHMENANDYGTEDYQVVVDDFYPEMRYKCPDYVDSCSMMSLSGNRSICNLNNTYTYKAHKNKACGQPTIWKIPLGAQLVNQTDSTVTVRFPSFGRYVIYGTNPLSCVPIQDSIVVIAESKTPPLNLGPDQELCPQNTTVLRAGPRYFSYEWQDGSTDSVFVVNQPGQYWVQVRDSCDNILRDTILIKPAPPIPFSIGNDRFKCNSDTIHLTAPSGFMNYNWSPAYNINSTTDEMVIINPDIDTVYTIMAEVTPGCFGYDTIRIKVSQSPPVNLGGNTSFCIGDSAVFDAGSDFVSYNWSNGLRTQSIKTFTAGQYSVIATTQEGCNSYDTITVVNVYPLPTPQLDQNPVICAGVPRVLKLDKEYVSYQWNTGAFSPTITIAGTGHYAVEVTDVNGCRNSVSTTINFIQPTPALFLDRDTVICSYGILTLSPSRSFSSYRWSNGSTSKAIEIRQPGEYSLEVKDEEGCTGKDTILVKPKDCLQGLFVPSAFTPNGDGKNDDFKPMLFGNIKRYEFTVFNRVGNVVFRSTQPVQGWDGRYKGLLQGNEVFIWTCKYELEGQPYKTEKGTVVLIR